MANTNTTSTDAKGQATSSIDRLKEIYTAMPASKRAHYAGLVQNVLAKSAGAYQNNYNSLVKSYQEENGISGFRSQQDTAAFRDRATASANRLRAQREQYTKLMDIFGNDMDAGFRTQFSDMLNGTDTAASQILDYANNRHDFYSQFKDEDEYKTYQDMMGHWTAAQGKGYNTMQWYDAAKQRKDEAYDNYNKLKDSTGSQAYWDAMDAYYALETEKERYLNTPGLRTEERDAYIADYDKRHRAAMDAIAAAQAGDKQAAEDAAKAYRDAALDYNYAEAMRYGDLKTDAKSVDVGKAQYDLDYEEYQKKVAEERAQKEADYYNMPGAGGAGVGAMYVESPIDTYRWEDSYRRPRDDWSEDEKNRFYSIYANDKDAAFEYAIKLNKGYNEQAREKAKQDSAVYQWMERREGDTLHNILSGAAGYAMGVITAPEKLGEFLDMSQELAGRGVVMNAPTGNLGDLADAMIERRTSELNEKGTVDIPLIGEHGWGDVYQLGESIAQSMSYRAIGGEYGAALSSVVFFGTAAKEGLETALASGADPNRAWWYAMWSGLNEAAFEYFSIDKLIKMKDGKTLAQFFKNIIVQAGIEGSEEFNTTLANTIAQAIVMGDKSELNQNIQKYVESGMSYEDAKKLAWKEWSQGILSDFIGGAISGGISGGAEQIGGYAKDAFTPYTQDAASRYQKTGMNAEAAQEAALADRQRLFDTASGLKGTDAAAYGNRLQQRTQETNRRGQAKDITVRQAQKLGQLNADALAASDIANTTRAVQGRLAQFGITDEKLAQAITATALQSEAERIGARGFGVTREQRAMVEESGVAKVILSEMDVQNLRNERVAKAARSFAEEKGASQEYLDSLTDPFYRGNEWVKKMKANKALAADVYGSEADITQEELNSVTVDGKEAKIVGKNNGKIIVEQDGKVKAVGIGSLGNMSRGVEMLLQAAPTGDSGAAFLRLYKSGQNVGEYAQAWYAAEEMYGAQTSLSFDEVRAKPSMKVLTDNQLRAALEIGRKSYDASKADAEKRGKAFREAREKAAKSGAEQRKRGTVNLNGGEYNGRKYKGVSERNLTDAQKHVLAMVRGMADVVNINFVVYDGDPNEGGSYIKGGTVMININSGKYAGKIIGAATLAHEMTHFIQEFAPEEYQALKDFIVSEILKKSESEFNRLVQIQMDLDPGITKEEAVDELIANACQKMLLNSKAIERLARKNLTVAEKIRNWIGDMRKKFSKAYEEVDLDDGLAVYEAARAIDEFMEHVQDAWDKGLEAAAENVSAAKATGMKSDSTARNMILEVNGMKYVQADRQALFGNDPEAWAGQIEDYIHNKIRHGQDVIIPTTSGEEIKITADTEGKSSFRNVVVEEGVERNMTDEEYETKLNAEAHIDELVSISTRGKKNTPDFKGIHGDKANQGFNYRIAYFRDFDMKYYRLTISVMEGADGKIAYNIGKVQERSFPEKVSGSSAKSGAPGGEASKQIIANESEKSNTQIDAGGTAFEYDAETDSVNEQHQLLTWEASDYVTERNKAAKEIADKLGISQKKARDYIDSVNSVAKYIAENKGRLDYEDTGRSPFVSNVEYGGSFDFTTLCKKRRLLSGTFSAIQNALKNTALTANEILEIRKMMDDAGLEVSCGKCYVEGSRASMGIFTKEFLKLYEKYNPGKWVPNMAQMNTPDGIEWVRNNHPEVYEQYEYFWNHYGTLRPGDPNLFASQQKPKLYQMRSAYKGEILQHFKNDSSIREKNKNGGIRFQSFSDFEIVHLLDAMQVIMDMSRVGLNGQAYTKVPDFAWALGKTGLKINLSIDAWDVVDGKLVFNNKEGMNFDEAMRIRDANSKNVGTICCVYDDAQLLAALADPRIDFIIPFHRSQWKKSQYKGMGLPATTKDYTYQQNEKWLDPSKHTHEYRGRQVKDKCTNYMPNEYWDFSKSGKENAEEYLRMCARDGKRPKFYKFLTNNGDGSYSLKADGSTDGYWKLLIDFKMYDNEGNGSPQMPVRPDFNMNEIMRMLESYEGGHNTFPVAHGVVNEFVSKYKAEHKGQQFQKLFTPADIDSLRSIRQSHPNLDRVSIFDFDSADIKKSEKWARQFYSEMGTKSPFFRLWFGDWRAQDQHGVRYLDMKNNTVNKKSRVVYNRDMAKDGNRGVPVNLGEDFFEDSIHYAKRHNDEKAVMKLLANIDDVVENAILLDTQLSDKNNANKKGSTQFMHILYAPIEYNGAPFLAKITVEEYREDGILRAYNAQRIKMSALPRSHFQQLHNAASAGDARLQADEIMVSQLFDLVKQHDKDFKDRPSVYQGLLNKDGTPKVLYHQTGADFWQFSTANPVAGANDSETPNGIFFKDNDHDIGLTGQKQMAVYLSAEKMLHFADRKEANAWYQKNIQGYKQLQDEMNSKIDPIDAQIDELDDLYYMQEAISEEEYDKKWNDLLAQMKKVEDSYRGRLRKLLDDYFIHNDSGYDGIELDYDGHRYINGKRENVHTFIVFKNTQVKSATDNIGTFDKSNPDIRYQKLGIGETTEDRQARKESFDNLKAENKILRERAEYWKAQTRTTKERTVRQQDTDKLANELLRKYNSKADREDIKAAVKELGDWLVQTDELDYDELKAKAETIAEDIISGNYTLLDNSQQEQLDRLKDYLKSTPVNLTKSDFNDTGDEGFRKKYGRYFTVSENGRTIDSLWGEMAAMFGEGIFPEDTYAPGDMLNMIADYLDLWKPQYGNEFEMFHDEAVDAAANELIDAILSEEVRQTPATFADKAQQKLNAQIVKDKAKLDALREAKNVRIAELQRQAAEKNKQIRLAEKALKYEAVSKVKKHYQDMIKKQRNKRSDTSVRGKIRALHKELTDILLKPKEGRYVPKELVKATAEILGAIDTTSGRAIKAKAAFAELTVKYEELAKNDKYALAYDETISDMIQSLTESLGDGSIYDLTGTELENVYDVLKALKHTIVTANKLVGSKIEADAFDAANQWMREIENAKGIPTKALRKFVMAQMTPSSFFRMAGGYVKDSMSEQLFNELNNGQLTQTQILMEGGMIFRELIDDKKNMDKLHDKKNLVDIGLKDDMGNTVKITRGMMLSVYMHLLNEQNAKHVAYGGFTVPKIREYYANKMKDAYSGKTGRAVAFAAEIAELNKQLESAETVEEQEEIKEKLAELQDKTDAYMSNLRSQIEEQLTEYDRKWIAAAQEFFDVFSKNKLNEVTEMVYGFSKARVDGYFPIHTDPNYRAASFDTIARDMSLENAGFMKERVNGANPILLEDITDVISSQLRRTAQYVGLMPAIRNFNKVYGKARAGYTMSVQSAMNRTFENEGKTYIENLLADLNGARHQDADIFDMLRGNMAGAVLTLNPRVALSQTASYPTAAAEIGYKPLIKALKDIKNNPNWNDVAREEVAKWTPLWWYRMQGFSTVELGDIKNNEQFMSKVMDKMKWATGWIQFMDGMTTGALWQASKYYVDDNFSDLEKGSDEYMMKVAEVYNRVIEKTQPDYTTMQRPDILRNPNKLYKQLTMFMTQRLQNMNILYDAAATYSHYVRDAAAGRNGVTSADVKQARTRLVWAVSSQVAASATIVIFKALADFIMHNLNAYRDDDDELTAESVSKTLLANFAETIISNMLWGSELYSALKSIVTRGRYYGISLNGVDTFMDLLEDSVKTLSKVWKGDWENAAAPAWKLTKAVAQFFGVPLGNMEKIAKMSANYIEDAKNGTFMEAGVDRTRAQNTHILFDALQRGDTAKASRIRAEFKDKKDEQAALKGYIKEMYTAEDQKIRKAETISLLVKYCGMTKRDAESLAQKWTMEVVTGIKYDDLKDEFLEGRVQRASAEKYLKAYGGLDADEAAAKVTEWLSEKETGIAYSDIGNEVKTGRLSEEKAIQMLMKYGGKSEDAATKTVNGYAIEREYEIKPSELEEEYLAGNVDDREATDILLRYKYYGKENAAEKAAEELERMRFVKANPDAADMSITQVRNYKASGLSGVVSAADYLQAAKMMGTFSGEDKNGDGKTDRNSVVKQKLAYIDTLNITKEQKTALAIALGISERTIRKYAAWRK